MSNGSSDTAYRITEDGTIQVPSFAFPVSAALCPQTRQAQAQAQALNAALPIDVAAIERIEEPEAYKGAVDAFRAGLDAMYATPLSDKLLGEFPVTIEPVVIAGVPGETFTPTPCDASRILLNLHGGGFCSGSVYVSRIESIPVAHMMGMKVVSIDYRQGYEHKHPAAVDDILAVYRALLADYAPENIIIYGGSAGAILSLQSTLRIIAEGLPVPAAIGVLNAGGPNRGDGDYFSAIGSALPPPTPVIPNVFETKNGYFSEASSNDPFIDPSVADPAMLAQFPPSMILTATRAFDLSPAIAAHRALVRAGAEAALHVFDGLGHCFYYDASGPEASEAYQAIIRFFRKHLKV